MEGMEQKFDGHCWVRPMSTRICFHTTIRSSKCVGHLICSNSSCPIRDLSGQPNEIALTRKFSSHIGAKGMTSLATRTLSCFHCGNAPTLLRECLCLAYYILPKENKSRLFRHQGSHNHLEGGSKSCN